MKLSVSLPEEDVAFLDAYARAQGIDSRSAALHRAVEVLRAAVLASAYEQWDLSIREALMNELRLGYTTLESGETAAGVSRFTGGEGRQGRF